MYRWLFTSFLLTLLLPSCGSSTEDDGDTLSIGRRFHYETSFGDRGLKGKTVGWGKRVPLYKQYPDAEKTKLPPPAQAGLSLAEAIQRRQSIRSFSEEPVGLDHVSRILLSAAGITHTHGSFQMRTAPSGGALYPIDIYVIVDKVDGLENGLYHFQVSDSSLELVKRGEFNGRIHTASHEQGAVGFSPLTLILTARFDRSTVKYADRGYRYVYMEAGAICQNIYLQAAALDMGTVAVGAFNDDAVNRLLELDGAAEATLLIMPVGCPAP